MNGKRKQKPASWIVRDKRIESPHTIWIDDGVWKRMKRYQIDTRTVSEATTGLYRGKKRKSITMKQMFNEACAEYIDRIEKERQENLDKKVRDPEDVDAFNV